MKVNYKSISTLLIVILIGILVGILIRYYNTPIRVSNPVVELSNPENNSSTNQNNPIIVNQNSSGDLISQDEVISENGLLISSSGELNIKNDEPQSTNSNETEKEGKKQNIDDNKGKQVIITSEDTMTNKEKREILTELDNTLMELLDVVDKVQTVDETRLITDESEVQK